MKKGKLITFEGPDGCGKTTIAKAFQKSIQGKISCVFDCEPTHEPIGNVIRQHLKENDLGPQTFLFLFLADRFQHIKNFVEPNLKKGSWVLLDRYMDSSWAYQSLYCQTDLKALVRWTSQFHWFLVPERTYLIELPFQEMGKRTLGRNILSANDRAGEEFYNKVADQYKKLATLEPKRFVVLDGELPVEALVTAIHKDLELR